MSTTDLMEPVGESARVVDDAEARSALYARPSFVQPQTPDGQDAHACPSCAAAAAQTTPVYALGRVEPRFPRMSVEREFAQAIGRDAFQGLTDRAALQRVLLERRNRYLARQLCFVFVVSGIDTYILVPRDPQDLDALVDAVRPQPNALDIDAVIGMKGPLAPPALCNGLVVPIVAFDQIYSFDRPALLQALPRPEGAADADFDASADEVLERVMHMADNAGATSEHRALNYLAMRYPAIYSKTFEMHRDGYSMTSVEVRRAAVAGTRDIVDVIFGYTQRQNEFSDKVVCKVDVTDRFPFLVGRMQRYYDKQS